MPNLLARLLKRTSPATPHLAFTVYTRRQCCCCHKALDVLENARARYGFTIDLVDVDSDPALAAQFGDSVPVVVLNGKVRFRGKVEPVLLERLLHHEAKPASPR